MKWDEKTGICIKNLNKKVIDQNPVCENICGNRVGTICADGCMAFYEESMGNNFNEGMHKFRAFKVNNNATDAVVINDGENLVTILYPLKSKNEKHILDFKKFGLSQSEMRIMSLVIEGYTNEKIAKKLFISKSTLKTHLNNIYKKLPLDFKMNLINRR